MAPGFEPPVERSPAHTHGSPGAPLILGILGGIASGKSSVAKRLAGPRGVVIDADLLAHQALDSPAVLRWLRERLGPAAIGPDGCADRGAIARAVFSPEGGAQLRAELEHWTHPLVRARIMERLGEARAAGAPRIVLDVPLLLENDAQHGLARLCDLLVFVEAPADERDRRAQRERGWPAGEVARREATQLPLTEKKKRAHHVIHNHQSLQELAASTADLLAKLALR